QGAPFGPARARTRGLANRFVVLVLGEPAGCDVEPKCHSIRSFPRGSRGRLPRDAGRLYRVPADLVRTASFRTPGTQLGNIRRSRPNLLACRKSRKCPIGGSSTVPPAGLEPAISCVKGRRPDR